MILLDGSALAKKVEARIHERVVALGRSPRLVIVRVGDDPRSTVYINRKVTFGARVGVDVEVVTLALDVSEQQLHTTVRSISQRADVDGVIVQSPIGQGMNFLDVVDCIDPVKDVDGLSATNLRRTLERARLGGSISPTFRVPATALGIETLLTEYNISLSGARVLVVGRSLIAGLSAGLSMLAHDATITVAHAESGDLSPLYDSADVVILAAGKPGLYGVQQARPQHAVVDVGITVVDGGKVVGDADFAAVAPIVRAISPVPGGVGPMTVASLFENVVAAAYERNALLN